MNLPIFSMGAVSRTNEILVAPIEANISSTSTDVSTIDLIQKEPFNIHLSKRSPLFFHHFSHLCFINFIQFQVNHHGYNPLKKFRSSWLHSGK